MTVLVVSAKTAANLRYRGEYPFARLVPLGLSDGRYALGAATINDRRFALQRPLLATGTLENEAGLTFAGEDRIVIEGADGKPMYLTAAQNAHAFGMPSDNVFRFETRIDESGYGGDAANGNRRSELISNGDTYGAGETLWTSFSFVVGPAHLGLDAGGLALNLLHQWHSVDTTVSRSPVLGVSLSSGNLVIYTRSDTTGTEAQPHYSQPRPNDGVVHHVVIQGALGASGHLSVWLDGVQIVNVDTAIGYYNDDAGARDLAYPHWGMYQNNIDTPTVVFVANIERGTTSLAGRVASPLATPVPPGGWV